MYLFIGAAFAAGAAGDDWPTYAGPNGNFSAGPQPALVEDLSQARVLWDSEEKAIGHGKGRSSYDKSGFKNMPHPAAGTATPIVADGKVFVSYFVPSGEVHDERLEKDWIARGHPAEQFKRHFFRVLADDVVIAIDAETGRTVWKKVFAGAGLNLYMNKYDGWGVTPAYHGGKVFAVGTMGQLRALDARTGEAAWESDIGPYAEKAEAAKQAALKARVGAHGKVPNAQAGLAVADGVLLAPDFLGGLRGVETATGKLLWQAKGVIDPLMTPTVPTIDGRQYILCGTEKGVVRLLEPRTGREVWKLDGLAANKTPLPFSDKHFFVKGMNSESKTKKGEPGNQWVAYQLTLEAPQRAWAVPAKYMAGGGDDGAWTKLFPRDGLIWGTLELAGGGNHLLVLREADGQVLAELDLRQDFGVPLADRFLGFNRISHLAHPPVLGSFIYKDGKITQAPGQLTLDKPEPAHGYLVPLLTPVVDGRLYYRTQDGYVRCIDLRKQ